MNPLSIAISALIGYAIGTLQVLALDWFRSRSSHRRRLRVLRAELRRLSLLREKYGWDQVTGPPHDWVPRPPVPTDAFVSLVVDTDFYLTDEHDDDNTQLALLEIVDGCDALRHYVNV